MVAAQRAHKLRQHLALAPGESALLVMRGPGTGSMINLGPEVVALGRHGQATVVLDDVSVSRHHAEIRPRSDGYWIVDVGSLNGTYVNRIRVEEARLKDGDEIQIGLFKLHFLGKEAAPSPRRDRPPEGR